MKAKIIFALLCAALASGCASMTDSGGDTPSAPKFLKGTLQNGVYRSQDGRFTVRLPRSAQGQTPSFLQISEHYGEHTSAISFGPAASDASVYHLELIHKTTLQSRMVKLKSIATPMLEGLLMQITKESGVRPEETLREALTLGGREAMHWRLRQTLADKRTKTTTTQWHDVYLIDFNDDAAIIWVQLDPDNAPDDDRHAALQFAQSLAFQ